MKISAIIILMILLLGCSGNKERATDLMNDGDLLHRQGNCQAASKVFLMARDLNPERASINYNIGCSYFESGDYQKAIEYFDNELRTNKSEKPTAEGYLFLAKARYLMDQRDSSCY